MPLIESTSVMIAEEEGLRQILCCPRCKSALQNGLQSDPDRGMICANRDCLYAEQGFPDIDGVPALVDFGNSIISRKQVTESRAKSYKPRRKRTLYQKLRAKLLREPNLNADRFAYIFEKQVLDLHENPNVLVIGGGSVGSSRSLYRNKSINIIGSDIYRSDSTSIIADGHSLPLLDRSVQGVWIGAVLEHVLTPSEVVSEIHRVLVPGGIVFAESPFMQQVHEGPFDFTRFTLSGHRWLFRYFEEIESCVCTGPSSALIWSIRYYAASIFGSYKAGTLFAMMFSWVRLLRPLQKKEYVVDGASGVMFLGRRSENALSPKDMITYYSGAQK